MERDKCPLAKTKTLSLLLRQRRATTGPVTDTSKREEVREFSSTSNLQIRSNDRKEPLRREYQA